MTRRKNPDSPLLLLAVAGVAIYFAMRPKAAANPIIGVDTKPPLDPIVPDTDRPWPVNFYPPVGFMPTDNARMIQRNLNMFIGDRELVVNGLFDAGSWLVYQQVSFQWLMAANYAKNHNLLALRFLVDPMLFFDPVDSDKITFRLHGSSELVTLRKSLYDKLSAGLMYEGTVWSSGDDKAWMAQT